jgi:deoxyhypusine synthase
MPDQMESIVDNKFVRDKSYITQEMSRLQDQISNIDLNNKNINFIYFIFLEKENYYDKEKLSVNVFDDFEKQTSWQSFTTLLITDIANEGIAEKKNTFLNKTMSNNNIDKKEKKN